MVALFRSAAARLSPSTTMNINKMAESPINQEPREMQISFMGLPQGRIWPRMNADPRESETKQFSGTSKNPRLSAFYPRLVFFFEQTLKIAFRIDLSYARWYFRQSHCPANIFQSRRNPLSSPPRHRRRSTRNHLGVARLEHHSLLSCHP